MREIACTQELIDRRLKAQDCVAALWTEVQIANRRSVELVTKTRECIAAIRVAIQASTRRSVELVADFERLQCDSVNLKTQDSTAPASLVTNHKKRRPKRRRIAKNAALVDQLPARPSGDRAPSSNAVHPKQVIGAQVLSFPVGGRDHGRPKRRRNATALLPLEGAPLRNADVARHVGSCFPASEDVGNGFHSSLIARDKLSSQLGTTRPVTDLPTPRTMRPMGKSTTPGSFKREFCQRLKAARIMAGMEQADVAKELGLLPNTYSKYEKRSLLPHHLMLKACEFLHVDLDYLYGAAPARSAKGREAPESAIEGGQSRSQVRA